MLDLLEIATYVFACDQSIARGGNTVKDMGLKWRRDLDIHIPVREVGFWRQPEIRQALEDSLYFLSEDNYSFTFTRMAEHYKAEQLYFEFGDRANQADAIEEVILFSGGLDSLGGAVKEAVVDQRKVALVSHKSTFKLTPRQDELVDALRYYCGAAQPVHIPVLVNKSSQLTREFTQRTRSFLFSALAVTVARLYELNRIRFYENGVTSLNFPISEQLLGALASRTTHPKVLKNFCHLYSLITEQDFTVENPFVWKTKTDVINFIGDNGCKDLIRQTTSCSRTMDASKLHTHCGCCSQCIDRRFGALASRYGSADPAEMYGLAMLTGNFPEGQARMILASYIKTAQEIRQMDVSRFSERFPEIARTLNAYNLTSDEIAARIFDLHARHAAYVTEVLSQGFKSHARDIMLAKLPATCALVMALPAEYTRKIGNGKPKPKSNQPVFCRKGEMWQLVFEDSEIFLADSAGLGYIAYLLARPRSDIPAYELSVAFDKTPTINTFYSISPKDEENLRDLRDESRIDLIDGKAFKQIRERYEELQAALAEAEADNNIALAESLNIEMEKIRDYLSASVSRHGKRRKASNATERMRKRFSIAITRAIERIEESHPRLAAHLSRSISTGSTFKYHPETAVDWLLS